MQYRFLKCPHCNYRIEFLKPVKNGALGTPILKCPNCAEYYVDSNITEWAILTPIEKIFYVFKMSIGILIGGSIFTFLLTGFFLQYVFKVNEKQIESLILIIAMPLALILIGFSVKRNITDLKIAAEESYERLSDPFYAQVLKSCGYNVPKDFLNI